MRSPIFSHRGSSDGPGPFAAAVAAIDRVNAADPNRVLVDGREVPKELAHAELMTAWVLRLEPEADEAQLLAARAHHLRRWVTPRSSYPEGRAGYLSWRTMLKRRHAEEVGTILSQVGYPIATIERVQTIIRKEGLATDPAVQTHEDALCLVFLTMQLTSLADDVGDEKTVEILRKTARKMSERGLAAASELDLPPAGRALLLEALQEP